MQKQHHILVVEDEEELRNSLALLLTTRGEYRVSVAADGAKGLQAIQDAYDNHDPIDLLITDLKMPVMTGLELIEVLHVRRLALPIIVITGHGGEHVMAALIQRGCVEYIEKPFDPGALINTIARVLERPRNAPSHAA